VTESYKANVHQTDVAGGGTIILANLGKRGEIESLKRSHDALRGLFGRGNWPLVHGKISSRREPPFMGGMLSGKETENSLLAENIMARGGGGGIGLSLISDGRVPGS